MMGSLVVGLGWLALARPFLVLVVEQQLAILGERLVGRSLLGERGVLGWLGVASVARQQLGFLAQLVLVLALAPQSLAIQGELEVLGWLGVALGARQQLGFLGRLDLALALGWQSLASGVGRRVRAIVGEQRFRAIVGEQQCLGVVGGLPLATGTLVVLEQLALALGRIQATVELLGRLELASLVGRVRLGWAWVLGSLESGEQRFLATGTLVGQLGLGELGVLGWLAIALEARQQLGSLGRLELASLVGRGRLDWALVLGSLGSVEQRFLATATLVVLEQLALALGQIQATVGQGWLEPLGTLELASLVGREWLVRASVLGSLESVEQWLLGAGLVGVLGLGELGVLGRWSLGIQVLGVGLVEQLGLDELEALGWLAIALEARQQLGFLEQLVLVLALGQQSLAIVVAQQCLATQDGSLVEE
jgi:hypothetical protein